MNKIALLGLSVVSLASYAMDKNFNKVPNYQQLCKTANTEIKQHCHYDPKVEVVRNYRQRSTYPTICLHGWGGSKEHYKWQLPNVIPGDIIYFNFQDASDCGRPPITQASFGQKTDMLPTMLVLKALNQTGLKGYNIFGHSRGGQTAINTIGALNDPSDGWNQEFKKIGFTEQKRKEILKKIKFITLLNPLTNVNTVIREKAEKITDSITSCATSSIPNFLKPGPFHPFNSLSTLFSSIGSGCREASVISSTATGQSVVSVTTYHKPWREQAINSLDLCKGLKLKILLSFQHNDQVLGNKNDVPFAKKLIENNPDTTWVVLGTEGHAGGFNTIAPVIPALYSQYGGVTDIDQCKINQGNQILSRSQPTVETVEEYITNFYGQCNKR